MTISRLEEMAERVVNLPGPRLIAFDIDGTLAPVVRNPADARVPEQALEHLRLLQEAPQVMLAFITGRDAKSANTIVPLERTWLGAEHGRVLVGPGPMRLQPPDEKRSPKLLDLEAWLAEELPEGALVEKKPAATGVHVRALAEQDEAAAAAILERVRTKAEAMGLFARDGRKLIEAELERHDKVEVLQRAVEASGAKSVFFIGDDFTDFRAIQYAAARGIGLFVKSPERTLEQPDQCTGTLDGPQQVADFVEHLVQKLC